MAKRRVGPKRRKKKSPKKRASYSIVARWQPSRFALWSQRWGDPNNPNQTYPTTVLLRHPTAPFIATVTTTGTVRSLEHKLKDTAHAYLTAANSSNLVDPSLNLPQEWLDALDPDGPGGSFGWLPFQSGAPGKALLSFYAPRTDAAGRAVDLMVILLASDPAGSGFGIRVVAHVSKLSRTKFEFRISGLSASFPFSSFQPIFLPQKRATRRRVREAALIPESELIEFLLAARFRRIIASTLGLDRSSIAIQGIRLPSRREFPLLVEFYATGRAKTTDATAPVTVDLEPYYSFVLATNLTRSKDGLESTPLALVSKIALVADAAGPARIFPIDPASQNDATDLHKRRATRSERVLDGYRRPHNVPDPLVYAPDGYDDEVVVVCPGFVLEDFNQLPATPKSADLTGGPPVRSNDASAVEAYWNVKQFFDRLRAYGLPPNSYFRIAPLPIEVHYRSGVGPGPGKDGQTVNARVRVKGFPDNFEGPVPRGAIIEMHFALADLSTRARKPWDGKKRSPAEPLGIAADARWVWHEIGHVLLTTSVGELQFRFAHSPGDALAAIVSDPESNLATDPNWRGSTFPWVFLPRRHDRCVLQGWSWSGGLHYGLSQVEDSLGPRRKGYWSEQILSSSLFRLYRSIGGDTTVVRPPVVGPPPPPPPDLYARRSASHYCVYLIMRGIQILGTSLVVPTNEPDQFVSALIDADINTASITASWHVVFPPVFPPPPPPPPVSAITFDRIGGCVHKVIRWAFEAQGLYRSFTNAPGYPPPVDVYIADLRPISESTPGGVIDYGPGSYNPVSLEWDPNQVPADPPPKWQADPAAISLSTTGQISVVVGNRGNALAQAVSVSVWWRAWPGGPAPQWDAGTWQQCAAIGPVLKNIPPNGQANFGPFAAVPLPPGRRYLLLAQATCPDDRSNVDPATNLPCSQKPTPLVDLVANDNNLGLRVLNAP